MQRGNRRYCAGCHGLIGAISSVMLNGKIYHAMCAPEEK
jgi:hypothetical protein